MTQTDKENEKDYEFMVDKIKPSDAKRERAYFAVRDMIRTQERKNDRLYWHSLDARNQNRED